ncbi:hypothetical protein [Cryptosporangium minutisporangium]|uniref:Uncharacterized protein n=1 Tax=Cryptosporangium minutisporangium TaxID=113569 RepID=A0ABP6T256_9ACTN
MTSEQDSQGFGAAVPKPGPPPAPKPGPPSPSLVADSAAAEEQVAAVLAHLDDLDERPIAEHVAAYETVHRTLQDTLAAVDGS